MAADGARSTRGLVIQLVWLYLAGVLAFATVAYVGFAGTVTLFFPGRRAPLWQYALAAGLAVIGAIATLLAGRAYVSACRRATTRPVAFALRWLGGAIALASLVALVFYMSARSVP